MKYVLAFAFVALLVCVCAEDKKKCDKQEDCGEDECCVYKGFFRGGQCKSRGQEKDRCNAEDAKVEILGNKYLLHCPCSSGLSCEPEEIRDIPIIGKVKINERCVVSTEAPGFY